MTTDKIELTESPEPIKKKSPAKATKAKPKATTTKKAPTPKSASTTPKKPRQKKLTLKSIQAKETAINTLSTYVLNEETNEVIKYYKIFDEYKIQGLITECFDKINYAEANDIEFFTDDSQFGLFISFLVIKHFTHFEDELEDSSLEQDISALNTLITTGLYYTILDDILDGNEIVRVTDKIEKHIEGSAKAMEAQFKLQQETYGKVESPTIKGKLENTESYRNVLS